MIRYSLFHPNTVYYKKPHAQLYMSRAWGFQFSYGILK